MLFLMCVSTRSVFPPSSFSSLTKKKQTFNLKDFFLNVLKKKKIRKEKKLPLQSKVYLCLLCVGKMRSTFKYLKCHTYKKRNKMRVKRNI